MMWIAGPLLLVALTVIVVVFFIILILKIKKLKAAFTLMEIQQTASELLLSDIQISLQKVFKDIENIKELQGSSELENTQVSKQLEHRIKTQQEEIKHLAEKINILSEQQPQDKFYARAYKLAAMGADLEEIMQECDLPRAEVEMLLAVYNKQAPKI